MLCLLAGCSEPVRQPPPAPPAPAASGPLRLWVVDDPGLAAAIERQWRARAEGELQVRQLTSEELLDPRRPRLAADAVIYPSGLIGELAERELIVPLREDSLDSPDFARRDIFDLVRQAEIMWGDAVYAVPFGSPQFTVAYRRDVFAQLGLRPPETWEQYSALAAQLADRKVLGGLAPPEGAPWHGTVEPLGPGWAGQVLLARAAVYARHRNYFSTLFDATTMEPQLTSPPFVRALEELVAAARWAPPDATSYTPADARRALLGGRCALALCWPTHASEPAPVVGAGAATGPPVAVGFAELPASAQVYHPAETQWVARERGESGHVPLLGIAGRLGSVAKGAVQPPAAAALLARLSGLEWGPDVASESPATTVYRSTHIAAAGRWVDAPLEPAVAQQYAELVKQTQRRPLWLFAVRIPGRQRYLAALDAAVHETLRGDKEPAEALAAAADQWRRITAERGLEAQKKAYWRSLTMEP